jgi:hypothetical protein
MSIDLSDYVTSFQLRAEDGKVVGFIKPELTMIKWAEITTVHLPDAVLEECKKAGKFTITTHNSIWIISKFQHERRPFQDFFYAKLVERRDPFRDDS